MKRYKSLFEQTLRHEIEREIKNAKLRSASQIDEYDFYKGYIECLSSYLIFMYKTKKRREIANLSQKRNFYNSEEEGRIQAAKFIMKKIEDGYQ